MWFASCFRPLLAIGLTLWIGLACAQTTNVQPPVGQLSFSQVKKRRLRGSVPVYFGFTVSPSGVIYSMRPEKPEIVLLTAGSGHVRRLKIRGLPQTVAEWQLGNEIGVDGDGFIYVPGYSRQWSLKEQPSSSLFGVLVFSPRGRYRRTIHLSPPADIRHLVVDDARHLLVLGVDLAALYQPEAPCRLAHEYDATGMRLTTFSECSPVESQWQTGETPGHLYFRQHRSARGGQLIAGDDKLQHALYAARLVRVFDPYGNLVREIQLEPPERKSSPSVPEARDSADQDDAIQRVALLSEERFLIQWEHIEDSSYGRRKVLYLGMCDRSGRALSDAAFAPGMLLFVDPSDQAYFLDTLAGGEQELIRARINLRLPTTSGLK